MFRRLAQLEHQDRSQDPEYRLLQQQKLQEQHQQQQLMEQQIQEQQRLFLEQAALEQARQVEASRLVAIEAAAAPIHQMEQQRTQHQKQLLIDQEERLQAATAAAAVTNSTNRILLPGDNGLDEQGAWSIALEAERKLEQRPLPLNPFSRDPMLAIDEQIDRRSTGLSMEQGHAPLIRTAPRTVDRAFGDGFFLDSYDFCTEMLLTTPKPLKGWPLECLQLEFLKVGGKPEGLLYPSLQNQGFYNSCLFWKEVLEKLHQIRLCAKGIRCTQEQQQEALQGLIGVMGDPTRLPFVGGVEVFFWRLRELVSYQIQERIPSYSTGGAITGLFALTDLYPAKSQDVSCELVASDQQYVGVDFNGQDNFGITKGEGRVRLKLRCAANGVNLAKVIWLPAGESAGSFSCSIAAPCSLSKERSAPLLAYEVGIVNQRNTFVEQRFPEQPFLQGLEHGITYKNKVVDKLVTPGKNGYIHLQGSAYFGLDQIHFRVWQQFTFLFRMDSISLGTNQILTVLGLDEKLQGSGFWVMGKRLDHTKAELVLQQSIDKRVMSVPGSIPVSLGDWHLGCVTQLSLQRWSFTVDTLDLEKALFITNVNRPLITYEAKKHDLIWGADRNASNFTLGIAWIHFFQNPLDKRGFEKECKYGW